MNLFVFPYRTDRKWLNKTQKYVGMRKSCPGEALTVIRLSIMKFAEYYILTSTLDQVHGNRNGVLAVYLSKREPTSCLLLSLSSASRRRAWVLDTPLHSFKEPSLSEIRALNAVQFEDVFCYEWDPRGSTMTNHKKLIWRHWAETACLSQKQRYSKSGCLET